jgi:dienelactone hydrolase
MRERYRRWMHDWEARMTSRDNNRVVRPFGWGSEWAGRWPTLENFPPPQEERDKAAMLAYWTAANDHVVANSDQFYGYKVPSDFRLEKRKVELFHTGSAAPRKQPKDELGTFLRFTSAVESPYPENNCMNARWFPARGRRAVVVLPHWNADGLAYNSLCRVLNWLGIAVLRLSMPYHDIRRPVGVHRADYAVSANIGRTIDSVRQGVIDARCCLDWLESQGFNRLGIVGTSLGSCYAFIATAHDPRIRVAAFNHASTYFADVVWHGQSTRHIREGLETAIGVDDLRSVWRAVSPMVYFDKFSRWPRKSLIIYAKYDLTFLPEFSRQVVAEFEKYELNHKVVVLPCGHYSMGEFPYNYLDGWQLANFLRTAFD